MRVENSSEGRNQHGGCSRGSNLLKMIDQKIFNKALTAENVEGLCKSIRHVARTMEPALSAFPVEYKHHCDHQLPYVRRIATNVKRDSGLRQFLGAVPGLEFVLKKGVTVVTVTGEYELEDDADDPYLQPAAEGERDTEELKWKRFFEGSVKLPSVPCGCISEVSRSQVMCVHCLSFVIDPVLQSCGCLTCCDCINNQRSDKCDVCEKKIGCAIHLREPADEGLSDRQRQLCQELLEQIYSVEVKCTSGPRCPWKGRYIDFAMSHSPHCSSNGAVPGLDSWDYPDPALDEVPDNGEAQKAQVIDIYMSELMQTLAPFQVSRSATSSTASSESKYKRLRMVGVLRAVRDFDPKRDASGCQDRKDVPSVRCGEEFEILAHEKNSVSGFAVARRPSDRKRLWWCPTAVFHETSASRLELIAKLERWEWTYWVPDSD